MFPLILGITAKVAGTVISAWQAAAIGVGIGAVGSNLMKNNQNQQRLENDIEDDDELEEIVRLLRHRRSHRNRKKKLR